jgi:hypothetical protein
VARSFVLLSLFERMPPVKYTSEYKSRFEIMRRGARKHDLSHCMAAGGLVVVAQADESPLPFPLEVQGEAVAGVGTTFYQAVVPLKRAAAKAAATQPVAANN